MEASATVAEPVLEAADLCLSYRERPVLQGLDFRLVPGQSYLLTGPSGAGKTTLLKAFAGLLPFQGELRVLGQSWAALTPAQSRQLRTRIGFVFQRAGLFDFLTCLENLTVPLQQRTSLSRAEQREKAQHALEEVGLGDAAARRVHELSGGMQKRLGIARALLFSPELLICDEPTAGLDPITGRSILELLAEVQERHSVSFLMATSNPKPARHFTEKIGMLWQGKIGWEGKWEDAFQSGTAAVQQFFKGALEGPLTEELAVDRV
ncbi:ATP-binding cassette domain-containing protein [bacterium]|nr:ATP-binding cassette domain-containing protein [bacterium]